MTIISVGKMWSRDGGSSSGDGRTFTKTFREGWQIVTTADTKTEEVEAAVGMVKVGDVYPGTQFVFCRSVNITRVGPIYWYSEIEYSGQVGSSGSSSSSPVGNPPIIRWGISVSEEAEDMDDNGQPITNSNGEPVEGITRRVVDSTLFVKRNYATFSQYLTRLYLTSVNSDYFQGWPPGTAKMMDFSADYVQDQTLGYWEISAAIHFREPRNTIPERAWWKRYINKGLYVLTKTSVKLTGGGGSGAKAYPVIDDTGAITSIALTDRGSGYTSAPTVTIESDDGSGATATASLIAYGATNLFHVLKITVSNPGSGYKLGYWRAVDNRKDPVTEPVLLTIDGREEKDANNTVWLERPVGVLPLPYNLLGLL